MSNLGHTVSSIAAMAFNIIKRFSDVLLWLVHLYNIYMRPLLESSTQVTEPMAPCTNIFNVLNSFNDYLTRAIYTSVSVCHTWIVVAALLTLFYSPGVLFELIMLDNSHSESG